MTVKSPRPGDLDPIETASRDEITAHDAELRAARAEGRADAVDAPAAVHRPWWRR